MVANFKNQDAQRRLLTAVIAAHPDLKLNFKGRCRSTSIHTLHFIVPLPLAP
jgi:hypothetical protein